MKKLAPAFLLIVLFACNKNTNPEKTNNKLLWGENLQTILPLETDTMYEGSDLTNAANKFDKEKIFSSITQAVLSGKLTAYTNYPGTALTIKEFNDIIVKWDSTNVVEDPNNPGTLLSAPLKMEINADNLIRIKFNETIELDTVSYSISKKVSFITLFIYKHSEVEEVLGIKKLFDVKLND